MCFRSDSDCVYSQSSFQASSRVGMRFPSKRTNSVPHRRSTEIPAPREGAAGVESRSVSVFLDGRRTKKSQALREGSRSCAHEFVPKSATREGGAGRKDSEKGAQKRR